MKLEDVDISQVAIVSAREEFAELFPKMLMADQFSIANAYIAGFYAAAKYVQKPRPLFPIFSRLFVAPRRIGWWLLSRRSEQMTEQYIRTQYIGVKSSLTELRAAARKGFLNGHRFMVEQIRK